MRMHWSSGGERRDYGEPVHADQCGFLRHSCRAGAIVSGDPAGHTPANGDIKPNAEGALQ
jgi:hypothetical protein